MQLPLNDNNPTFFTTEKESQYFDRKSARIAPKDTIRHICAFANASSGKLVIGIEDHGKITGFKGSGAHDIEEFEQAALVGVRSCARSSSRTHSRYQSAGKER